MGNKATLSLMEQSLMLLIFALCAALCLRAFGWAGQQSRETAALDRAVLEVQNTAEQLKGACQPLEATLSVCYDQNWQICDEANAAYCLTAAPISGASGLHMTEIRMTPTGSEQVIFSITAAWQEVTP